MDDPMTSGIAGEPVWLAQYAAGQTSLRPRYQDGLSMFEAAVHAAQDSPALHYFDRSISYRELDRLAGLLASNLAMRGVGSGDRIALYLQNVPQFVIGLVAAWKLGAIAVTINPMNREHELRTLLTDCDPRVLLMHDGLHHDVARHVLPDFPSLLVVTTPLSAFQSRNDARVLGPEPAAAGTVRLADILEQPGQPLATSRPVAPGQPATIVYTSGTTGIPKGAVHTHGNVACDAETWRSWIALKDGGPILAIAPLFHITGLIGHVCVAFATAAPLILGNRFHPAVIAELAQEYRAEFTVGAITAFISLMNTPEVQPEQLKTLHKIYSGGAPIPVSVTYQFHQKFGTYIRAAYGLTETTSMVVAVPHDRLGPVDSQGAGSIGVPTFDASVYIADDAGRPLPQGETGELLIKGPQVIANYWRRDDATREAFLDGWLRTGDMAYVDRDGWIFLVDRKKDMIIASGYKVWPKEVEDVIYQHPAVREAAVVGTRDDYRGETVKAVVSLKPGCQLDPAELISFCKERMAAYKYPRQVEVRDELPKTPTGKILRRELR
jgi:long-chain acyl-CoA synthetase